MVLALLLGTMSCFPVIANLSKGDTVPDAVAERVPSNSKLLVLPLWYGSKSSYFHSPYVIAASAIGTVEANVPRRVGMYLDTFVCGGPTTWVDGYLIITDSGSAIWNSKYGENETHDILAVKRELLDLVEGHEAGPVLRKLILTDLPGITLDVSKVERELVRLFVVGSE